MGKHSGRVLTLQPNTGTADLNALFFGKKKEEDPSDVEGVKAKKHILCVNTYQMVLLLMFNSRDKITYEEMRAETLIPDRFEIFVKLFVFHDKLLLQGAHKSPPAPVSWQG